MSTSAAPSARPEWFQTAYADFQDGVAHTIILHGNIHDYVEHADRDLPLADYLATALRGLFTVANFAPDRGITFPGPSSVSKVARDRFLSVIGAKTDPAPVNPAMAALQRAGGATPPPSAEVELPSSTPEALPLLVQFLSTAKVGPAPELPEGVTQTARTEGEKNGCVIVERLDLIAPPAEKSTLGPPDRVTLALLHRVGTSREIDTRGNLLILLVPSLTEVHPDLLTSGSGIRAVAIPPPDVDQRRSYSERMLLTKSLSSEMTASELAIQTAGLNRRHIEDIGLRAVRSGVLTRELVKARKREQMATEYADVLEIMEPDVLMRDVGGHTLAKSFLQTWVIDLARSGDEELLGFLPKGVTLLGPPGTGKTYLSRAVAQAIGWNCVQLRMDLLKGSLVGESERRLAKAIVGITALAPCLVYIDELDQAMPKRVTGGTGSGGDAVQSTMFGRLLEFFGDPKLRGRVIAIGASNRPDQVDAAMFRPGRFDVKIPLLPPVDGPERTAVLTALLEKRGTDMCPNRFEIPGTENVLDAIGESTANWTQAELEKLVLMALASERVLKLPLGQALMAARARMKKSTREIEYQTALAIAACDDLDLVPEQYRAQVGEVVPDPDEDEEEEARPRARRGRSLDES